MLARIVHTMGRTALELGRDGWRAYRPGARTDQEYGSDRWERAWEVAKTAGDLLRRRFGATRVVAYGSLSHHEWFTPWSDIDLAAWGIAPAAFYRAVAAVTGLSAEFKVDLIAPEDCLPALRRAIEREGVAL
jgi:predicted nucleotidyltransferase